MNLYLNREIARDYDNFYETPQGKAIDNIEKKIITVLMEDIPCEPLLELGCGTGHWTQFLVNREFHVTATDASEEMLKIARGKKINNVVFQQADATMLPFADQSFSIVVSITMLEFVKDETKALSEIDRVLKSRGHLVLGCLNSQSELGKNKGNDEVFRHARFFSPEEIRQMLSRFGKPRLETGVYYSPAFELLDDTESQNTVHPAFIGAVVQKK
ncbi:methyltransferase domain-containing protein [Maribellus comscasis]|uniref:Methyltransferase domain-containing protein n=1 Tax=Maribellus comscasis TaxID=2681766 RepID=A0A6I6JSL7_9BACT|nr:class I SAM-dependent methyltransferase [Maribellus comscasis]QGY46055.1 methyltransferase domain-containing protein [Maribellus comscasis]